MAGEWIWRAFGGSNETVKKGLFLTMQAMAAGMVWFYGRCGKAGNAKNRRRSAQSRGKSDGDEFETPVSSPGKSAKSAKRATPFKTPLQTPVKASVKTPIKNAVKTPVKSAVKSAVKSVVSSLLLTPVTSLSASLSGCKGSDWKQEGPVRRLFQNEDEEDEEMNEDWWEEEEAKGGRRKPRYEVDSEDALSASDEEIRRILDDE